jgi:predicted phosphodiesterase
MNDAYVGLLCIGDPHLASRAPGFRKDDYSRTILGKLQWALNYAESERLLPLLLGDVFHWPRDNANWLIVELLDLFRIPVLAVSGNHDCNEDRLTDDDTLAVLCAAGRLQLLDRYGPWRGKINGTPVAVGGTSWGQAFPDQLDRGELFGEDGPGLVFWLAHHDILFPGYEEMGRIKCREIGGIDVVINGHIHRPLKDVVCGGTAWLNPGNISRVTRSDGTRERKPAILRIDVANGKWTRQIIELPHQSFEEVFHPAVASDTVELGDSLFIRGLKELQSFRTPGEGLREFLDKNLDQFEPAVAMEIRTLAEEVLADGQSNE